MANLRELLREAGDPPALDEFDETALRRRVRRIWGRRGVGMAVVLAVALGGWAVLLPTTTGTDVRFAEQPQGGAPGRSVARDLAWSLLPPAPLSARWGSFSAWTGTEFVVWGGYTTGGTPEESASDGAAYDPETGRWRRLAPAPVPGMYGGEGVWTGRELWVLGGTGDPNGRALTSAPAAYRPADDTWRRLPDVPVRVLTAAWSEEADQVLIAGADAISGQVSVWTLGADGTRWKTLPAPAVSVKVDPQQDEEFQIIAAERHAFLATADAIAALDLRRPARWTTLPEQPTRSGGVSMAARLGANLLVAHTEVAAMYEPGSPGLWPRVPPPPVVLSAEARLYAIGERGAIAVDTVAGTATLFDLPRARWERLPALPLRTRLSAAVAAGTTGGGGTRLFVWGGRDANQPFIDGATLFRRTAAVTGVGPNGSKPAP